MYKKRLALREYRSAAGFKRGLRFIGQYAVELSKYLRLKTAEFLVAPDGLIHLFGKRKNLQPKATRQVFMDQAINDLKKYYDDPDKLVQIWQQYGESLTVAEIVRDPGIQKIAKEQLLAVRVSMYPDEYCSLKLEYKELGLVHPHEIDPYVEKNRRCGIVFPWW